MSFIENILNNYNINMLEDLNYDRIDELLDIFETPIAYDDLIANILKLGKEVALKKGLVEGTSEFDEFVDKYVKDSNDTIYLSIMMNTDVETACLDSYDELVAYVSVGINWMLDDCSTMDEKSCVLYDILMTEFNYNVYTLFYRVLKYMNEHFRWDDIFKLPK